MRKYLVFIILIILYPNHVFAQSMAQLCNRSTSKEVASADYVGGVDVHGKKIMPANIGSSASGILPDPIIIPINLNLAALYGLDLSLPLELMPDISTVKIYQDGRITYNDKDITSNIAFACEKYHKENREEVTQPHGQKSPDALPSSDIIEGQYPAYNE
tara:strand:- start:245 stop:721 length:477 start_codon:yes stop_codon:yes gene_type:complete